ncbi:hypothetical protein MTP99_019093 [Tenebrio molitor]|nr:hypothetical protein MTP99_019093 [Tenebrio molitor]
MSSATILRTWPSCPGVSASGRPEDTRPPSHQRPPLLAELGGRHSRNHTGHFRGPRRGNAHQLQHLANTRDSDSARCCDRPQQVDSASTGSIPGGCARLSRVCRFRLPPPAHATTT